MHDAAVLIQAIPPYADPERCAPIGPPVSSARPVADGTSASLHEWAANSRLMSGRPRVNAFPLLEHSSLNLSFMLFFTSAAHRAIPFRRAAATLADVAGGRKDYAQ